MLGLVLLSVALIAYQIILVQILSIVQWYHFAYMIISVALLGFATSGTLLTLIRAWAVRHFNELIPLLMITAGLMMGIVVIVSQNAGIRFDSYLIFSAGNQVVRLLFTYLLFFLPFFFAAIAIGLIFIREAKSISRLYFANLLGSGLGGILALVLMRITDPASLPALPGLLAVTSGIILIRRKQTFHKIFGGISICTLFGLFLYPPQLTPSQFKSISQTLDLPESKIIWQKNDPYGLVQVVTTPALRYAPGISLSFNDPVPAVEGVFVNGNWYGPLMKNSSEGKVKIFNYTLKDLPYRISDPEHVLVLDAGTGWDIEHALFHGAGRIKAVEAHPLLPELLESEKVAWWYDERVSYTVSESRSFLRKDSARYDLIIIPTLNSFGGNSGLNALEEKYMLTEEAFNEMWNKLNDEGMLTITTWMDYPPRYPLKVLASISGMLSAAGIENTNAHIIAVRSWGAITFLVKRIPVNSAEIQRVIEFCDEMMFDPALFPEIKDESRMEYNRLQDNDFFDYLDQILSHETRLQFLDSYDFNVAPATDDRPYFSQFLKLKTIPRLNADFGYQSLPYFELGYLIVLLTLLQILIAGFVLIILPLLKTAWTGVDKGFTFFYFGAIGIGYMFVEIVLIQQMILYLGSPVYATAFVITLLLMISGFGSFRSVRISMQTGGLIKVLFAIVLLLLIITFIMDPVIEFTMTGSATMKLMVTLVFMIPLAYLMGMPFPVAISYLSSSAGSQIPWAWSVNGYFSVISTVIAVIISVEIGFSMVMLGAAIAYFIALIASISVIGFGKVFRQ